MDTANTQAVSANIRLRYNYRSDCDLYVIYNVGTRFASLTAANPQQLREQRFAVKLTYSFTPTLMRKPWLSHSERGTRDWPGGN